MSDVSRRRFLKVASNTVAGVIGAGLAASAARAGGRMSNDDIIRAWKDEAFRNSLTDEQRSQLPFHPAGSIEIGNCNLEATHWTPSFDRKSRKRCC